MEKPVLAFGHGIDHFGCLCAKPKLLTTKNEAFEDLDCDSERTKVVDTVIEADVSSHSEGGTRAVSP